MSENFAETFRAFAEEKGFENLENAHSICYIQPLIETFESHGVFLDGIPIDERNNINEKIFQWYIDFYLGNYVYAIDGVTRCYRYKVYPKIDAGKKINKIVKIIENFQKMIDEQFGEELKVFNDDENYPFYHNIEKFKKILVTLDTAAELKKDLIENKEEKKFRWLSHLQISKKGGLLRVKTKKKS